MKQFDKLRSNQESQKSRALGNNYQELPLCLLSLLCQISQKEIKNQILNLREREKERERENRFQKSSYPLFGTFQQKRRKMEISYFRALLGTGGNCETPCFLSGSYGHILSTGQDIWVPLRYQVLFSLCLLSVLGAPICPYVCQFMFVFVLLFE